MIISIASGKGGTGKTTVAVSMAFSLQDPVILDCDVEEPNSHIFIKPDIKYSKRVCVPVPEIDDALCDYCGVCREVCAYHALAVLKNKVLVFPELCHGCGACAYFCPRHAIRETAREIGFVETGEKDGIRFVHGRLNVGEAKSPPLIKAVKEHIRPNAVNIIDAPPGTSCPVIESVKGSDFCVLVTEPTPFGLNDLVLAIEVLRKLHIPFGVVINRSGLGDGKTDEFCAAQKVPVLMRIPFKREIASAYARGVAIAEGFPEYKGKFRALFDGIGEITAGHGKEVQG